MGKQIICTSCGAEFDNDMAKCPYCGTMNYEGAEKEYLEKLEDVREDLDDLNEVPLEETKKEFKKQGKLIRNVLIVAAVIGLLLFGWSTMLDKAYERDSKADFLWKSENFPVMDELYEAGEYEKLAEFYRQAQEEDKPVFEWDHYKFMDTYLSVEDFYSDLEVMERQDLRNGTYASILWNQWHLLGLSKSTELTEEEKAYFKDAFTQAEMHLQQDWGFDEKTYREFYEKAVKTGGYVGFDNCEKYIKKWKKGVK